MGRVRSLVIGGELRALLVGLLAVAGGCATGAPAAERIDRASFTRPSTAPRPPRASARPSGIGWFAVRAPCTQVTGALEELAAEPGSGAPRAVRMVDEATWCAVTRAKRRGARDDSTAQGVSSLVGAGVVALFATDAAWSYTIFDAGRPVASQEGLYGAPFIVGDLGAGAGAIGVSASLLESFRARGAEAAGGEQLSAALGFARPDPGREAVAITPRAPRPIHPDGQDAEPVGPKFAVGDAVVMPPLGVMLVTAVQPLATQDGTPSRHNYTVVAGQRTLTIESGAARRMHLRRLATRTQAEAVLAQVREAGPVPMAGEYLESRAQAWLDGLKRGDLKRIGAAFAQICRIRARRDLYALEEGFFDSARTWLVDELSAARGVDRATMENTVDGACGG